RDSREPGVSVPPQPTSLAQQAEIMRIIDRSKERENLLSRHDWPLNRFGLRLAHVFSGIFAKVFLFLGKASNCADVGEAVTRRPSLGKGGQRIRIVPPR
ncbi:MAG TPA: hypothetical protein VK638_07440, partial [Edaphobacter sp.]|nr:hypothetical protein [Edaphobacter sp.]